MWKKIHKLLIGLFIILIVFAVGIFIYQREQEVTNRFFTDTNTSQITYTQLLLSGFSQDNVKHRTFKYYSKQKGDSVLKYYISRNSNHILLRQLTFSIKEDSLTSVFELIKKYKQVDTIYACGRSSYCIKCKDSSNQYFTIDLFFQRGIAVLLYNNERSVSEQK